MDWRHRAVCHDQEPELFFPVGTSGPALLQIAEAKSVCRRCPVVSECLTWALVMWISSLFQLVFQLFCRVDMSVRAVQ